MTVSTSVNGAIIFRGSDVGGQSSDPLLALSADIVALDMRYISLVDPVTRNGLNNGGYFTVDFTSFLQNHTSLGSLQLSACSLRGTLPSDLSFVTPLERLYLQHNRLTGSLPQTYPSSLELFYGHNNSFTGSLPAYLPPKINYFFVSDNQLSGSIPSTLLENLDESGVEIDFTNNSLSGSIPDNLFTNLSSSVSYLLNIKLSRNMLTGAIAPSLFTNSSALRKVEYFEFHCTHNGIQGTLPPSLFSDEFRAVSFLIDFTANHLSGSVPSTLLADLSGPMMRYIFLRFGTNQLNGAVPMLFDHMNGLPKLENIIFDFTLNRLSGSITSPLVPHTASLATMKESRVYLSSNAISGTIPSDIIETTIPMLVVAVSLDNNALTGTISPNILSNTSSSYISLIFHSNKLTGLPLLPTSVTGVISHIYLDMSSNNLGVSLPDGFFTSYHASGDRLVELVLTNCSLIGPIPTIPRGVSATLDNNRLTSYSVEDTVATASLGSSFRDTYISIQNNLLEGSLNLTSSNSSSWLYLKLRNNRLNELIVSANVSYLLRLDIGENPDMAGTIPSVFFQNSSKLVTLLAENTKLSGEFPRISNTLNSAMEDLDLSGTDIDFCGDGRQAWNSSRLTFCDLTSTNATQCAQYYPSRCFVVGPNPAAPPTTAPSSPSPSSPTTPGTTAPTPKSTAPQMAASGLATILATFILVALL